jgi:hypothetical protein
MHILIDFQVAPSWGQVGLIILVSNHPIISIELNFFAFTLYHMIKLGLITIGKTKWDDDGSEFFVHICMKVWCLWFNQINL